MNVQAQQNDTIDLLCWRYYGRTAGVTEAVIDANKGISAREEFSDARWVYRFRVEASKEIHRSLLTAFNATPTP